MTATSGTYLSATSGILLAIYSNTSTSSAQAENLGFALLENVKAMTDQELAVWYNDNVIYPNKVRLNSYYYRHYSFWKDIEMIFATVLGWKVKYMGEEI